MNKADEPRFNKNSNVTEKQLLLEVKWKEKKNFRERESKIYKTHRFEFIKERHSVVFTDMSLKKQLVLKKCFLILSLFI